MTEIKGSYLYQVSKKVAETGNYRLYLCTQGGAGERQCLMQITTTVEHNGELQRAAYILKELQRRADELEEEYAHVKTDPKVILNYKLGFPELVDSFICEEQGRRQINILAFRNVDDVSKVVPLINITERDRLRVDLRTSAWIMGKLLKLLAFAHSEGISIRLMTGGNILIEPDQHYVLIFDWSEARTYSERIPTAEQRQEISQAAQTVITVLGGSLETGVSPDDDEEAFVRYTEHLLRLARGSECNAQRAHEEFYKLIDLLWERKYYPFTAKPLNR